MLEGAVQSMMILAGSILFVDPTAEPIGNLVDETYFEGRWVFSEESCDQPTTWTMIAGGNFVSEDLIGTWQWQEGRLSLNLTDLAVDEETGEAGGRFQMEGPVEIKNQDGFNFTIEPDIYQMLRCP